MPCGEINSHETRITHAARGQFAERKTDRTAIARSDFLRFRLLRLHAIALLEAINTSAGINQFLLAGEERMALRADIDAQLLLHGTRFKRLAANAANDRLAVVRMDLFLHGIHLTLTGLSSLRRRRHPINHTSIIIARKYAKDKGRNIYFTKKFHVGRESG